MVLKWGTKGVVENKKISPLRGIFVLVYKMALRGLSRPNM